MTHMAFSGIAVPDLPAKPRKSGVTAVLDAGLSEGQVTELVATAGEWIDVVKLGWGTARVQPAELIRRKVALYRDAGIMACTGGTLLEVAVAQERLEKLLEDAGEIGFEMVEVSNGVHPMSPEEKVGIIRLARAAGFRVWSEVGRKDPGEDARIPVADRLSAIERELDAGADKVVLEARESGTVGIYDERGVPAEELIDRIVERVDVGCLVFEAPRKAQQVWMIRELGREVNLGNVRPEDAVAVATLRLGLRGDTFADVHLRGVPVFVDMGANGALEARKRGGVIVMIDALRASATIVTALEMGMTSVRPVLSIADCVGDVTAGERGGRKLPGLDHGNSPSELRKQEYRGRQLVLTTTNGTEVLLAVGGGPATVLVGSALNASAVARAAIEDAVRADVPVTLLLAGRNNQSCIEDELVAAEILHAMGPEARLTGPPLETSASMVADFFDGESGQNLVRLGYAEDVHLCAQVDRSAVVPVLRGGVLVPLESSA